MRPTLKLSVNWLADEISALESTHFKCFALVGSEEMIDRLRAALRAGGLRNVTRNSWADMVLIRSTHCPEGSIVAVAPAEHTFEGIATLLGKYNGKDYSGEDGRVKVILP